MTSTVCRHQRAASTAIVAVWAASLLLVPTGGVASLRPDRDVMYQLAQAGDDGKPPPVGTGSLRSAPGPTPAPQAAAPAAPDKFGPQPGPGQNAPAPTASGDLPTSIPQPHGDNLRRAIVPNPVRLTGDSVDFFGGVAVELIDKRCLGDLSSQERAELATVANAAQNRLMASPNYSDADIGNMMRQHQAAVARVTAGITFTRTLACPNPASTALARAVVRAMQSASAGPNGGAPVFAESCPRNSNFNQTQCQCLMRVGMAAIPDIAQRPYRREIIHEIIQRNPVAGMQIGLVCRIINY